MEVVYITRTCSCTKECLQYTVHVCVAVCGVCMCVCVYVCVCTCVCMCTCVCARVCVFACTHVHYTYTFLSSLMCSFSLLSSVGERPVAAEGSLPL